jgi:hypothetical protein
VRKAKLNAGNGEEQRHAEAIHLVAGDPQATPGPPDRAADGSRDGQSQAQPVSQWACDWDAAQSIRGVASPAWAPPRLPVPAFVDFVFLVTFVAG